MPMVEIDSFYSSSILPKCSQRKTAKDDAILHCIDKEGFQDQNSRQQSVCVNISED